MKFRDISIGGFNRKFKIIIERLRGVDFRGALFPNELGLDSDMVNRSSPSGDKYLKNVIKNIGVTANDSIIDVGCGKGSTMRMMLKFPFKVVDGIELSEYIANIAKQNFKKLRVKRSCVFVCDAVSFNNYNSYNPNLCNRNMKRRG